MRAPVRCFKSASFDAMDDMRSNRALANLQARVKQLERTLQQLELPPPADSSNFPTRAGLDLTKTTIDRDVLENSTLLTNLYDSIQITRFCVGTWPTPDNLPTSTCVHGMVTSVDGTPYEFNRLVVFPSLISASVPFSTVSVEPQTEQPKSDLVKGIIFGSASHIIQLTPGKSNLEELMTIAFLAGRGNENIHIIENGVDPLTAGRLKPSTPNIVGSAKYCTERQRCVEAHSILSYLAPHAKRHPSFDQFVDGVLLANSSSLTRFVPSDAGDRVSRWKSLLSGHEFETDAGMLVAAAFVRGLVVPIHGDPALPVAIDAIERGHEWQGNALMYKRLAPVLLPATTTPDENYMRSMLFFFSIMA